MVGWQCLLASLWAQSYKLLLLSRGSCTCGGRAGRTPCGRGTRGRAPPGRSAAARRGGSSAARPPSPSPWRPAARARCSTAASRPRPSCGRTACICNVNIFNWRRTNIFDGYSWLFPRSDETTKECINHQLLILDLKGLIPTFRVSLVWLMLLQPELFWLHLMMNACSLLPALLLDCIPVKSWNSGHK